MKYIKSIREKLNLSTTNKIQDLISKLPQGIKIDYVGNTSCDLIINNILYSISVTNHIDYSVIRSQDDNMMGTGDLNKTLDFLHYYLVNKNYNLE